jgi:hypothetical protein
MDRRQPSSQRALWAVWLCAAALLLKAAMPLLSSASAKVQGKALVEVCTVYGVALVPQGGPSHAPDDTASGHGGEHCALSALASLAPPESPVLAVGGAPLREPAGLRVPASPPAHDASAAWIARLEHGPPRIA